MILWILSDNIIKWYYYNYIVIILLIVWLIITILIILIATLTTYIYIYIYIHARSWKTQRWSAAICTRVATWGPGEFRKPGFLLYFLFFICLVLFFFIVSFFSILFSYFLIFLFKGNFREFRKPGVVCICLITHTSNIKHTYMIILLIVLSLVLYVLYQDCPRNFSRRLRGESPRLPFFPGGTDNECCGDLPRRRIRPRTARRTTTNKIQAREVPWWNQYFKSY